MHRRHKDTTPEWVHEMTDANNAFIDRGITWGLLAMGTTEGLRVDAKAAKERDVLALAFRMALTAGIPLSTTVGELLDRLTERASTQTVRPMTATPPGIPRCPSSAAAGGSDGHVA